MIINVFHPLPTPMTYPQAYDDLMKLFVFRFFLLAARSALAVSLSTSAGSLF